MTAPVPMTPENVRATLEEAIPGGARALAESGPDDGIAQLWLYYRKQATDTTTALFAAALIELARIRTGGLTTGAGLTDIHVQALHNALNDRLTHLEQLVAGEHDYNAERRAVEDLLRQVGAL